MVKRERDWTGRLWHCILGIRTRWRRTCGQAAVKENWSCKANGLPSRNLGHGTLQQGARHNTRRVRILNANPAVGRGLLRKVRRLVSRQQSCIPRNGVLSAWGPRCLHIDAAARERGPKHLTPTHRGIGLYAPEEVHSSRPQAKRQSPTTVNMRLTNSPECLRCHPGSGMVGQIGRFWRFKARER